MIVLFCNFCGKTVSNLLPDDTTVRAALICPECIELGRITIPEKIDDES